MHVQVQHIVERLEHLSPERQAEVGDFIEFLHQRDQEQHLRKDFAQASNAAIAKVWDNDDDAIYDTL
jgi:hypothetical protein